MAVDLLITPFTPRNYGKREVERAVGISGCTVQLRTGEIVIHNLPFLCTVFSSAQQVPLQIFYGAFELQILGDQVLNFPYGVNYGGVILTAELFTYFRI